MTTSNRRQERVQVTVDEITLLRMLVMVHVASRLNNGAIESWEAGLLTKLSRAYNRLIDRNLSPTKTEN